MQQHQAQLKVYKSSAGSGKTTSLAIEYLKLSLGTGDQFKSILALTFTNKAAQEMKERILEYLLSISNLDQAKDDLFYIPTLLKEVPKYAKLKEQYGENEVRKVIQKDAKNLYKKLLHHYSEYAVTTLDSFTNRIIRSFSHDLGLSFNYQVEMDTPQLLKLAVEELVSRIDKSEDLLTRILTRYSQQKINNENSPQITEDLKSRAYSLLNEVDEKHLKPLREMDLEEVSDIHIQLEKAVLSFENELQSFGKDFISLCEKHDLEGGEFYRGASGIYAYFKRIAHKKFDNLEPKSYVLATIEEDKWYSGKASSSDRLVIDNLVPEFRNIYSNCQHFISEKYPDYLLMNEMNQNIFPFMVLMELEKILNQMKADEQMIHISDFNKVIAEKIAHETAPYIYERIGNKYRHYLLDEFQDTSVLQWHNLLPLVENSLSQNYFNLIVGDAKQAIYRWRGSDVEQFSQIPKLTTYSDDPFMKEREELLERSYSEAHLKTNYRTGKNIVDFNNQLFQFIKEQAYLPSSQIDVYKEVEQSVGHQKMKSSVELHLISTTDKNTEEVNQSYIERTYEIIQDCLRHQYKLKDIVILARKNNYLIELAKWLLSKEIPVVSTESLHADTSPLVRLVMSVIRHIYHPLERIYQVEILTFLHARSLQNHPLASSIQLLNSSQSFDQILENLEISWCTSELKNIEAYEAIENICRAFSLDTADPLLHFFIEASFIFSQEKHQTLREFQEWWIINAKDYKLDVPEDWDAVRLMSFHKAKGLEFPVVINHFSQGHFRLSPKQQPEVWINPELKDFPSIKSFPFKVSKLKNTRFEHLLTQETDWGLLDSVNLFYVAMTRPKQRLYLLVDELKDQKKNTQKEDEKQFRFDQLIHQFIQEKSLKEIDKNIFHIGDVQAIKKESKVLQLHENRSLKVQTNADWRKELPMALEEPEHINEALKSAEYGKKVHAVLAEIHQLDQLDSALRKLVYQGIIKEDEQVGISEKVEQVLTHPELSKYFGKDLLAFNEREIFDEQKKVDRPDRIVKIDDEWMVIDYKTGKENKKHHNQLQGYINQLNKLTGQKTDGLLVYLNDEILIVPFQG